MKVYFAGIAGNVKRMDYLQEFGADKLMLTYADIKQYGRNMKRFKERRFNLLFDSGAFSLWKRGIKIDIFEYCEYLRKHEIEKYIVLDKIRDPLQTAINQKIMEDIGMNPTPVFHMGSDVKYLEKLIDKYPYICLGGTVGEKRPARMKFFKFVFDRFPNHKFHGLGLTDVEVVKSFPFYSVDSTTWLIAEKVGKIFDTNGKRVTPEEGMTSREKFKNTISYFVEMEKDV